MIGAGVFSKSQVQSDVDYTPLLENQLVEGRRRGRGVVPVGFVKGVAPWTFDLNRSFTHVIGRPISTVKDFSSRPISCCI